MRVLAELDSIGPPEMTSVFWGVQYDNLQVVVRAQLRIFEGMS